ncbi:hypothetical protein [Streptomyces sp. URMC 129]|uniref:hypothetical protein n=1 Tax=Streptomyces sp. URMC 129 TaxID=3423407 RepID=UPI003F1A9985
MPSYQEIMEQDFGALETAANELDVASEGFAGVADGYRAEVAGLSVEVWSGESGDFARRQFSETGGELDAATEEARMLAEVIREGRAELIAAREALERRVAEIRETGFLVNYRGFVEANPDWPNDPEMGGILAEQDDWQAALDRAVEAVNEVDQRLRQRLTNIAEGDDGRLSGIFNGATRDSSRAEDLLSRLADGDELSGEEVAELNHLLDLRADDPAFSRALMDALGGQGVVAAAAQITGGLAADDDDTRRAFEQLRGHLALALDTATQVETHEPGTPEYAEWAETAEGRFYTEFMDELRAAGTAEYEVNALTERDDVRGYQVLATVLEAGDREYSERFLHDLADGIRAAEDPEQDGDPDIWRLGTDDTAIDGLDAEEDEWFAVDPLDSMLGLMGAQPEVAAHYLEPVSGNDRLNYLLTERDWDHLSMSMGVSTTNIAEAGAMSGLGAALQAATTGVPAGSDPSVDGLNLTPQGANIMQEVVETFSADEAALIADGGTFATLRPDLARMTAAYMGDFQAELSGLEINDAAEGIVDLTNADLPAFLSQLGRDAESHGIITGAQQAYTALAVDLAMTEELPEGISRGDYVGDAVAPGAQMAGIMSEARANAVYEAGIAGDEEYNNRLDTIQQWTSVVLDEAVGRVAERYPVAGPVIEWGVGELADSIFSTLERDNSEEAAQEAGNAYDQGYQAAVESAENAVNVASQGRYEESDRAHLRNAADRAVFERFGTNIAWRPPESAGE